MNKTEKEFYDILNGMVYHMKQLSRFMVEHLDDEIFSGEEGLKIKSDVALMQGVHIKLLAKYMFGGFERKEEKKEDIRGGMDMMEPNKSSMFGSNEEKKEEKNEKPESKVDIKELLTSSIIKDNDTENGGGT